MSFLRAIGVSGRPHCTPSLTGRYTGPSLPSRIIVALPAYNEQSNLRSLLEDIHGTLGAAGYEHSIVVLDDGSRDRTPEILRELASLLPLTVETHAVNQGLGAALRDLLRYASMAARPGDIVITMDADESHAPSLILRMVERIAEGHDVVIASRFRYGAGVRGLAVHRVWISWLSALLFRVMFPTPGIRDFTCGFRAYRAEALQLAWARYGESLVDQPGFQCMADILLKMRRLPLVFGEVPMLLRYDLKKSGSKMRLARTSFDTLRLVWKRRMGAGIID
jgi:dolichol-phosphate mannosyltransferase